MVKYECVFIARQDISASQVETLTGDISKIIEEQGGKVAKSEQWGLRTLAYRINKQRKGYYVLMEFEMPAQNLAELDRRMRLNEDLLRHQTLKIEAFSEGPSVQFEKEAA